MLTLLELADALSATCICEDSADYTLCSVSSPSDADGDAVVFAENETALHEALGSNAGAVITSPQLARSIGTSSKPLLLTEQPRLAFAKAGQLLRATPSSTGIHATAIIAASARIGANVSIDAYTVIGERVEIQEGTQIGSGCSIGDDVHISADCHIYPRVVIYPGTTLGNRVVIHAGCVLGSDGFGYVRDTGSGAYTQFPQQGKLVVEDDVEIGANTTIDRGALDETRIERGTKLDNLVHIGHNVQIGRNVVIAAQTGISGSSSVGYGAVLGGQVGIGDHAHVGPGVILGGGTGVLNKKILRGVGMVFWGRPAQPLREYLKGLATLARITRNPKG